MHYARTADPAAAELELQARGPREPGTRSAAIDAVRGFALLGILLMNVVGFAYHPAAYKDPTIAGGSTGANLAAWAAMHVVADGKMRALFSMLFGASLLLFTGRLEARGDAADLFLRRSLWLMAFGILHAYLLWWGDILFPYGLCALAILPLRRLSARALLGAGLLVLALASLSYLYVGLNQRQMVDSGRAAQRALEAGRPIGPDEQRALDRWEDWLFFNRPSPERLAEDAERWRGNTLEVLRARADVAWNTHSLPYYHRVNLDVWGMMLVGMALLKWRVLQGERSAGFYVGLALVGYAVGVPLAAYRAWRIVASDFDPATQTLAGGLYDLDRLAVALGHLAVVLLLCRSPLLRWFTGGLAAVGRTAFSNYVLQSLVCAFVFTGHGFALYGRLERYQLYYLVAAIGLAQLLLSPLWLRVFRFGPLEWLWRSLTYWRWQPLLRSAG
jgi:uncharacterized protein